MGLNRETTTFLNLASNGSFLHTPTTKARELPLNLSQITPTYEAKPPQELVEKQIAEPESFPNPYQPSAIIPDTGETPVLANVFEFKDEYFSKFGNTSNYHLIRKPQKSKSYPKELLQFTKHAFVTKTTKNLAFVLSHEWLEESELSSEVIRLDSPSSSIQCQINLEPLEALYNHVVGVNIMSTSFAQDLLSYMPLTPTTKLLKSPSGYILPSLGILYVLPIEVDGILVRMSFYIYDIIEFDLLIGQPIQRLLLEGQRN
jgi:hypothetical protein